MEAVKAVVVVMVVEAVAVKLMIEHPKMGKENWIPGTRELVVVVEAVKAVKVVVVKTVKLMVEHPKMGRENWSELYQCLLKKWMHDHK